jgi:outer membrane usher protein
MKGRCSAVGLAVVFCLASTQAQSINETSGIALAAARELSYPSPKPRDPLTWLVQYSGRELGDWNVYQSNGLIYIQEADLIRYGLRAKAGAELLQVQNLTWIMAGDIEGVHVSVDGYTRILSIDDHRPSRGIVLGSLQLRKEQALRGIGPSGSSQTRHTIELRTGQKAVQIARVPSDGVSSHSLARMLPLDVRINGAPSGPWILMERDGVLHASEQALEDWRLRRDPDIQFISHRGQNWFPLSMIPGFTSRIDFSAQTIDLVFDPKVFSATRLMTENSQRPVTSTPMTAGFLNYDLSHTSSKTAGLTSTDDLGALVELGFSGGWGNLVSGFVGRNLLGADPLTSRSWRRLETTFTRDDPDRNLTLRLGDSSTKAGVFGRALYFGGISLSKNFDLSPGFITQPIPVIKGSSSGPGTVELYVNDALRQVSRVPTGPFAIDNFPLLSGTGQAKVVVRDILGRETVVVQPFFSHSDLLEEGLTDWSIEAGKLRRNIGSEDNDYADFMMSGMWRFGVNKVWTFESRTEVTQPAQMIGLASSIALPWQALGQIGLTMSRSVETGAGVSWLIGTEYSHLRHGYSLRLQRSDDTYRYVGAEAAASRAYPQMLSASYNYSAGDWGSVGVGLARIETHSAGVLSTGSLNYSKRVGKNGSLTLSFASVSGNTTGRSVGLSLNLPLEKQATLSVSTSTKSGVTDGYVSYSQGLTGATGAGWRALSGSRNRENYSELGFYYQGQHGQVTADLSRSRDQQTSRLGAQGGIVATSKGIYTTRPVQDGFAIVEVPGYSGVGVGLHGPTLTHTDERGIAFLSGLMPFHSNSIRLDAADVPIGAEIDNLEQMAVPMARGGVHVVFPVRGGRSALVRIVTEDGEPAPAGADVEILGDPAKQTFFVARRGEAFLTGLQSENEVLLKWMGNNCRVRVDLPPAGQPQEIIRLGPLTCSGLKK